MKETEDQKTTVSGIIAKFIIIISSIVKVYRKHTETLNEGKYSSENKKNS